MPKHTIIRDSTQIAAFLECPQMWKYAHGEHITISLGKPNDPMAMGTLLHKRLEIYYKARARREGITESMDAALAFDPDKETCKCGHPKEEHQINPIDTTMQVCIKCLFENANHEFTPQPFPLEQKKRQLVDERFTVYVYTYSGDDIIPDSPDHVEVGFSHKLYEDDEKLYILEGRYDILANHRGMKTWMDHKGQMRMRDLYNKSIQFRNYDLVTEASIACINYIRMTQKVDTTTYVRDWVSFSKPERDFWRRRLIGIYDQMLHFERVGITPNDYNWAMCSGKFGYNCEFTPLCGEAYLPDVVKNKKEQLFHIRQEWKPW